MGGDNFVWGEGIILEGEEFSVEKISGGRFPMRGNFLGGNFSPGGIFLRGESSVGGIFLGGEYSEGRIRLGELSGF